MSLLSDFDWDGYQKRAGAQAQAINQQAFVKDPAQLATNPTASRQDLYAAPSGIENSVARSMIKGAFQQYAGRDPSMEDYQAWTQAIARGMPIDEALQGIAQTFKKDTTSNLYGSGMMAQPSAQQFGGNGLMGTQWNYAGNG